MNQEYNDEEQLSREESENLGIFLPSNFDQLDLDLVKDEPIEYDQFEINNFDVNNLVSFCDDQSKMYSK